MSFYAPLRFLETAFSLRRDGSDAQPMRLFHLLFSLPFVVFFAASGKQDYHEGREHQK